jgi:soluble lytic murein transglycosylase
MRAALLCLTLLLAAPALAQTPREAARLALTAASQNRWAEAESAAARAEPLARKLVEWLRLQSRNGGGAAAEYLAFVESAADWPGQDAIARNMEAALRANGDDATVLRWFATRPARSLGAALRHADALARAGRAREAAEAARRGWAETSGEASDETALIERFGRALTADDHWARFNRLAYARDWSGAQRVAPLLGGERAQIAQARIGYANGADPGQGAALAARDAGAALERARALRTRGDDAGAVAAFAAAAATQRDLPSEAQRAIWTERQLLARRSLREQLPLGPDGALRLGDSRGAYRTAAEHGQAPGTTNFQEAEFLAGFIALRFLNNPREAAAHFARVAQDSRSPITLSRGHYWRGLALAAQNNQAGAREAWALAANHPTAFYGQLASQALGEDAARLNARIRGVGPAQPTPAQSAQFAARELPRVAALLVELGEGRRTLPFLLAMTDGVREPWEYAAVQRVAARTGQPQHPVWVARRAGASGAVLLPDGWPTPYPTEGLPLEPALVNAITRQESNFDTDAVSPANARGLMQLLPATASAVARRLNTPHQLDWLQSRPAHNMRLGSAYLAERIQRFGGSWVLAIAAYNAGTNRIEEWLQTYGDPRDGDPRMIDWIEQIPFAETRNYVQRVIENVVVYRALSGVAQPLPVQVALR